MTSRSFTFRRLTVVLCIFLAFCVFAGSLVYYQVINGDVYAAAGTSNTGRNTTITAARGEIYDRNGVPLVTNRQGYSIVFQAALFPSTKDHEKSNAVIAALIALFASYDEEWLDNLPLEWDAKGNITFVKDRENDVKTMKSKKLLNLNEYATAQNCLDALIDRYKLEGYAVKDARNIASVRYEMERLEFSVSYPYTFAQDVSTQMVSTIKENSATYPGVEESIVAYREYQVEGWLAPHVIGRTGALDSEEYAEKKSEGYAITDYIGKNGIELAMESYLRGTNGKRTYTGARDGSVTSEVTKEPQQGNSVILTLDINMQRVAYKALEKVLLTHPKRDYRITPAGTVVVLNCNTGEVLASVSYPSYDITTYEDNAAALNNDSENAPLWNRVLQSGYSPGSTLKPALAIAGLETGAITASSTCYCSYSYKVGDGTFYCKQSHRNRTLTVSPAITESCNIFFYDLGLKVGIDTMNEYRTLFGLGQKTGVELPEYEGLMDSKEYRESIGQVWSSGYTAQAAIAQAGNAFTPMQMAVYAATLANGGTRYAPYYVKSIKSSDFSSTVQEKTPEVAAQTGISKNTLDIVADAMLKVCTIGYCASTFRGLSVQPAAKTGTNQVTKYIDGKKAELNSSFLVTYAPYDNPEIAIFVSVDNVQSSAATASVARAVYEYYYEDSSSESVLQQENTLLF